MFRGVLKPVQHFIQYFKVILICYKNSLYQSKMTKYEFSHWLHMYSYIVFAMNMGDGAECKTCIGVPEWFQRWVLKKFFSSRKGCRSGKSKRSCFFCFLQLLAWKDSFVKRGKVGGGGWSQVAVEVRFCKKAFHARKISGRSYNLFWIVGRIHGIAATSWPPPGLTGFLSTTLLPQICASRLTFFTLRRISEEIQFLSRTVLAPPGQSWPTATAIATEPFYTNQVFSLPWPSAMPCPAWLRHVLFICRIPKGSRWMNTKRVCCKTRMVRIVTTLSNKDKDKKCFPQNMDGRHCDNFINQVNLIAAVPINWINL